MKKLISLFLSLIMIVSVVAVGVVTTNAYWIGGLQLLEGVSGYEVQVTQYATADDKASIPATYNGKPVNVLSYWYPSDKKITVPGSIKMVLDDTFKSEYIEELIFEEGVEHVGNVFNYVQFSSNAHIVLPSSLKTIGKWFWEKIKNKTTLPEGCEIISTPDLSEGYGVNPSYYEYFEQNGVHWKVHPYNKHGYDGWVIAVDKDTQLTNLPENVIIPSSYNGIDVIAVGVIPSKLNSDNIPYAQGYIVKNIVIPNTVKVITSSACNNFFKLERIDIPDSVEYIGSYAFGFYDSEYSNCKTPCMIRLGNNIKQIGDYAFTNRVFCLNKILIPDSVESIGKAAFKRVGAGYIQKSNGASLWSVDWEDDTVFNNLTNYSFRSNVVEGSRCFQDITIPINVKYLGTEAFGSLGNLTSLTFESKNIDPWWNSAFTNTSVRTTNINDTVEDVNSGLAVPSMRSTVNVFAKTRNTSVINYAKTNNFALTITDGIVESGDSKNAIVTLTTDPAIFKVTVPTVLPFTVDSDSNVTVANNAQVVNDSNGQVKVTGVTAQTTEGWSIVANGTDFREVPVDSKQFTFTLNGDNFAAGSNVPLTLGSAWTIIDGKSSMDLPYNGTFAVQSQPKVKLPIANTIFTIAWNKAA